MRTNRDHAQDLRRRIRTLNYLRLLFSALALGLIIFGLFTLRETSRSRGWVGTSGRVILSNVSTFTSKGTTTYRPMVDYSYSVDGTLFTSSRITFHSLASRDRRTAAQMAARYPVGMNVPVLYDPQNPEQAVLERGNDPWLLILAGGVFAMLAVWVRMLRGRIEKQGARKG